MKTKKQVLYIGNKLSRHGNSPTSVDILPGLLRKEGFQVIAVSGKKNKILRLLDMVFSILRTGKKTEVVLIDTYSTQNFYYAVVSAGLCRILNRDYIPVLRGGNLEKRLKKSRFLSRHLFKNALVNVAPSGFMKSVFKSYGFQNCICIPNSIELVNYPFLFRSRIRPKLLWVRSFSEIYNPELALDVLKKLIEGGVKAELCMVGPDKDGSLAVCKNRAEKENLPVHFPGLLSKEEWIRLSESYDIFISTTRADNMPVSVLEAMALGMAVVSTNVGGIPFLITHRENGILVSPDNTDEFAEAVTELCNNPELSKKISENARKTAAASDWNRIKEKWKNLLTK